MARSNLALRAGVAIALMILFYAIAIASVIGLVIVGVKALHFVAGIHGRGIVLVIAVALVAIVAAGVIAWSVLPRIDRFEPPGTEVNAGQHPELFVEIRRIAELTGQPVPAHVYLVTDVNAFVSQRGGLMGFGSRRIMGIGLPLMRSLQVDELRAVLAHEMGHFYGGDTRLGPWIYKTRNALGRTVINLSRAGNAAAEAGNIALLFAAIRAPFRWFLIGYMRITQAISRAQEYSADAVAVRAEGKRALIDGLKKTHAAAVAHSLYLQHEIGPLVEHGVLPSIGEGFSRFLTSDRLTKLFDQVVEGELADGQADPYDSHPPLRERIAAASQIDGPVREPDSRPAIRLIRGASAIETDQIAARIETTVERVDWSEVPKVWEKAWRKEVSELRSILANESTHNPTTNLATIRGYLATVHGANASHADDDVVRGWWSHAVGPALGLILLGEGFALEAAPGAPFVFRRDDHPTGCELFNEVRDYIIGKTSAAAWHDRCEALGIPDRPLALPDA